MRRNLEKTRGLVFSGSLCWIGRCRMLREQAYRIVQAMPCAPGKKKAISAQPWKPTRKFGQSIAAADRRSVLAGAAASECGSDFRAGVWVALHGNFLERGIWQVNARRVAHLVF